MAHRRWLHATAPLVVLAALTRFAQGASEARIDLGQGCAAHVDERGLLRVTRGDAVVVREAFIGIWVDDGFSDQQKATRTEGSEHDGLLVRRGTIAVKDGPAKYQVFVRATPPCADGLRDLLVTYVVEAALFPKARAAVLVRFPLAEYANKTVRVGTTDGGVFPDKLAANNVLVARSGVRELLIRAADKDHLFIAREDAGDILVQDARKWGADAYEAQFQLLPTRSRAPSVRVINFVLSLGGARGPTIASVRTNRPAVKDGAQPAVPKFGLFELAIDLWAPFDNPYDGDDIQVTGLFSGPDGPASAVRGFFCQDFERGTEKGAETLTPIGPPGWRVRFTPTRMGDHSFAVAVRTKAGRTETKPLPFSVVDSDAPGYVSVHKQDPRYFQYSNGKTCFLVGHNVCWGSEEKRTYDYDSYLRRMGNAAENYARVWMCSWDTGIESARLDSYRLDAAWRLDYILRLAEERGANMMVCLDNTDDFNAADKRKLFGYWKENGGPCANVLDFFTDPAARAAYKRRLDYVIARWGYSPHVLAWELWNEMNYIGAADPQARRVLVAWTSEMARYIKERDPHGHMVTTSLGLNTVWDELWALKELDFAQAHTYLPRPDSAKEEEEKDEVLAVLRAGERTAPFGKPYFVSEFGYPEHLQGVNPTNEKDPTGVHLHNAVWGSLFSGAAGTPAVWWWKKYVHDKNLYYHYGSAARFMHGVDPADPAWNKLVALTDQVRILGLKKRDAAVMWIQARGNNWHRRVIEEKPLEPLGNVKVRVSDVEPGKYTITWWDTCAGEITHYPQLAAPAAGNPPTYELIIEHKTGAPDIAVKAEKVR